MKRPKYKRVLLKVSGETFVGDEKFCFDFEALRRFATQIKEVKDLGVDIGVMMGGGNIFRGKAAEAFGMERVCADYIGMLATVINALILQEVLEKMNVPTSVLTAIRIENMAELYVKRKAIDHLKKGRILLLAGGTGNPYFTTDTAACLRALEIGAEVVIKGTKVDGIFSADPVAYPQAEKFDSLSYLEVLDKKLGVMDATAVTLCMDNKLPIVVFNLQQEGNLKRIILGEALGTIVE
ncbi:MAG: uridylate kinase [candidate division Zixibacteria bacterium SM23_73_2]|nr:MAG: uridylate kinase [candidate division Zixibacteria bacterium SM23_73_2]